MDFSPQGLDFLKRREGLRLRCYNDSAGLATIGYGHLLDRGGPCQPDAPEITEEQAGVWLREDVRAAVDAINDSVDITLLQHQFDAVVSFVFNVGVKAFWGSTLLKKLNRGDTNGAARQFERWTYAGGRIIAGLRDRRARETMLFNTAFYGN